MLTFTPGGIMTARPVGRTTSRVTHATRAAAAAEGRPPRPPRPLSVEGLAALERDGESCEGLVLVAIRIAPHVTLESPEDLAERVRQELHGRWLRVFNAPHQMFTVGAWPAPADWQAPD